MKKITLLIVFIFSLTGFSQILTPFEGFESGTFPPNTPATWAVFDNGVNAAGINLRNWTTIAATAAVPPLVNQGQFSAYMDGRQPLTPGSTAK